MGRVLVCWLLAMWSPTAALATDFSQALQQALRYIPADRLLLETDAPYLLPRTLQPKPKSRRNEPAFLPAIAHVVAGLTATDIATLATQTLANSRRLFALPPQSGSGSTANG